MTQATYTKLRSGEWGVRVTGERVTRGSMVTVTKKDGELREEHIERVLWSGEGVMLCAIVHRTKKQAAHNKYRQGNCTHEDYPCCGCERW